MTEPQIIKGVLRGIEGETRHIVWQCPACGQWYSEDYENGDPNPITVSCGCSKHHPGEADIVLNVRWRKEPPPENGAI